MKILVADDSALVLKLVESQIRDLNDIDEIILCSDAPKVMDIIKSRDIDIVILDVVMPGKSGLEILAEIRQDRQMDDIQVIMLTSEPKYFRESFLLGSDDFLNKPFNEVELRSRLKAAMKSRRNIKLLNEMNKKLQAQYDELMHVNKLLQETQFSVIQQEKMALIGEMAAGIAHEINNPLGFLGSNIDTMEKFLKKIKTVFDVYKQSIHVLAEMSADQEKKEIILDAVREKEEKYKIRLIMDELGPLIAESRVGFDRVSKIVQTLKKFAHTNMEGGIILNNVNEIVEESLVILKNEYKYHIDIFTDYDTNDVVPCNKGQIQQVILNILINAIQAIKSQDLNERGKIDICTSNLEDEFLIGISDNGPGISKELFSRIFDPFFTTKDVGEGTGLGLSISNDIIVNKHKGRIMVSNNVEQGATFEILLPLHRDDGSIGG